MNKPSKKPTANETAAIESAQSCIADGITLGSRGLLTDAVEAFDRALSACRSLKGNNAAVRLLGAHALANKGAALGDLGRHAEAVECYNAAIATYRRMAERDPDVEVLNSYAVSVMNKGWALINLGRDEEGFRCHEEALQLRRQLAADGHGEALPDVARSLYNIGEGYFRAERFAKALPALGEAEGILRALVAGGQAEHEGLLAYVLAARADTLQMLGRLEEARDVSDEAIAMLKRLSRTTENPRLASAIATALDGRKTILRKLKQR
jgi:tetratricopeptide (TPR) repeat protein